MQAVVGGYQCEWAAVVKDPEKRRWFRAFVNSPGGDPSIEFASERGQKRPASGGALVSRKSAVTTTEDEAHA
jgi:nitrite reductase (NADH) large subunit